MTIHSRQADPRVRESYGFDSAFVPRPRASARVLTEYRVINRLAEKRPRPGIGMGGATLGWFLMPTTTSAPLRRDQP